MGLLRERHTEILRRLQCAIPRDLGEIFLEQEIPGDPDHNRPDLVTLHRREKCAIVTDVTILFEENLDTLKEAREAKLEKYSNLTACL